MIFCTWKWGKKYTDRHVQVLKASVARNYSLPHKFVCITDEPVEGVDCWPIEDPGLTEVRDGCYARLRMFDPDWQHNHRITKLVCLDLDMVITGDLKPLFDRAENFVILKGGHHNPCPFNGSVMMIRAGARPELWMEFFIDRAIRIADKDGVNRGTDQTWIAELAPDAAYWTYQDGIYAFQKPGWPKGLDLPSDARIVAFPGWRDPTGFTMLPWVAQHWRE